MGYYIFTNATNIGDIQSAIGSKDAQLLENVKETEDYVAYNDDDKFYQDLPLSKAVEDIIFGRINPNVKAKHSYGYAFICLCKTLGQDLPYQSDIKIWVETPIINDVVAKFGVQNFDIEQAFFAGGIGLDKLNIPVSDDYPMINILTRQEIQRLADTLNAFTISQEQINEWEDSNDDDGEEWAWASEHINGIKQNLAFCLENNANLCIFCH